MLLRPRQQTFVERSVKALHEVGNALSIAPTGAGKTVLNEIISSDREDPAKKLCDAAVKAGSNDDCTAIIISIKR